MSLAGRVVRSIFGISNASWANYSSPYIDKPQELAFLREEIRAYSIGQYLHLAGPIPLDNFSGETVEMRQGYRRAVLAEPAIKAALIGKIAAVQALGLQVRPYSKSPLDLKVGEWVKQAIQNAGGGMPSLIESILLPGCTDGYSVCEKVWRFETRGEFAGKIGLHKLKSKDSRYISFRVDPFRNVEGVISLRGNTGEMFPPSDFVIFSYMSLFESPFGNSDLRASYRAAAMIPQILNLRMIFLDKYTGPFLKAKVADPALVGQMKARLQEARQGGFLTITPADEVEILDLASKGTSDFLAALKDLREEVAMSISGAFLHMLTGEGQSGQRGSAAVQQDQVDLFIWLLAVKVAAALNEQLVPDLVNANYGANVGLPIVSLEAPNPEAILAELKIDESLAGLGVPLSLSEIYERSGRRPPSNPQDTLAVPGGPGAGGMGGMAGPAGNDFFANAGGQPGQPAGLDHPAAARMRELVARGGEHLGNGQANGKPAGFAEWEEGKHPRDEGGKFGSGGGGGGGESGEAPAGQPAGGGGENKGGESAKLGTIAGFVKGLPAAAYDKIKRQVKAKYAKLEARYGKSYAKAIIGAALVGIPLPFPGASVAVAAPVIAVAELHRMISGGPTQAAEEESADDQEFIDREAARLIDELRAEMAAAFGV